MMDDLEAEPGGFGSALVDVGGRFMTSAEMTAEGEPFELAAGSLYFRARTGILGPVTPAAAQSLLGIFPRWVLDWVWESSAAHPVENLVAAYGRALATWGRNHLTGSPRLTELAERVVDAADPSALPLFAGWQAAPRPEDAPARTAQALMLLRELRGGLHFAALRVHGLDVPLAVLADPRGGAERLHRTAWTPEDIQSLKARHAVLTDAGERWKAAESATSSAFRVHLEVLPAAERAELQGLVEAAEQRSRPPGSARSARTA